MTPIDSMKPQTSMSQDPRLMQAPPGDEEKIRALPWSIGFGLLTSSVFGPWTFFGSVFLLYLQTLGLPKGQIAVLLSLVPFCGLMAPLVAPALARWGAKRACIALYGGRSLTAALLLMLPLVLGAGGRGWGLAYLLAIILAFAVLRSLAETAIYPWSQEYTPASVRGRYGAVNAIAGTLAGMGALAVAGYLVDQGAGLGRFLWLQAAGGAAGLLGVVLLLRVPGGAPIAAQAGPQTHRAELREAVADGNFRSFLLGTAGLTLGGGMVGAFMPLLLVEKVGLPPGTVIWLDITVGLGSMVACLLTGWMADRYGSRTVLMPGLTLTLVQVAIWGALLATGQAAGLGITVVALLGFLGGIAGNAVGIGAGRLLFTGVVPPEKSVAYTAVCYSWCGLIGGLAPLLAGGTLSLVGSAKPQGGPAMFEPYTVLFLLSLAPLIVGWAFYYRTRPDGATRTRDLLQRVARRAVAGRING